MPCQGTFYILPNVEQVMARLGISHDVEFSEFLIEKAQVAVVPGSAFGAPGYVRLSFATSMKNLQEAIKRLHGVLDPD